MYNELFIQSYIFINLSKEIETESAKYYEYYLSINKCPTNIFTMLCLTFID